MSTFIFIVTWLLAGWFAVRMRILMTEGIMFDEEVNGWTPFIFLLGWLSFLMFMIAPESGFRRRALFLDKVFGVRIPLPKFPRPNDNLVKAWFGFLND